MNETSFCCQGEINGQYTELEVIREWEDTNDCVRLRILGPLVPGGDRIDLLLRIKPKQLDHICLSGEI